MTTLGDIGERSLIRDYLRPRYARNTTNFGDDTAVVPNLSMGSCTVVATTDPCPDPAASLIGIESADTFGHLLATIALSDLAAAGADPTGLLVSIELPRSTPVDEFLQLLDGLDRCCACAGTAVLGGNLKDSPRRSATAFALGTCETDPMTRSGAQPGDLVAIFGSVGLAWTRILAESHGVPLSKAERDRCEDVLVWPRPLVSLGSQLRRRVAPNACTDASDGLMAAIAQLATASGVGVCLDLDSIEYGEATLAVARQLAIEPWAIARSWGDWQLLCAVPPDRREQASALAAELSCPVQYAGEFTEAVGVGGRLRDRSGDLHVLDSERFTHSAPLLEWYAESIIRTPVFRNGPER